MIRVAFHTPDAPNTFDEFEGTVSELMVDLLTDSEWPLEFSHIEGPYMYFRRINTDDYVSFLYR